MLILRLLSLLIRLRCLTLVKALLFIDLREHVGDLAVEHDAELVFHVDEAVLLAKLPRELLGGVALVDDDATGALLPDVDVDKELWVHLVDDVRLLR